MQKIYPALRLATAATCAYECLSILVDSERFPTLSRLAKRHPWICPALLGALGYHL